MRQSQRDFKSVQRTSSKLTSKTLSSVDLIAASISKPCTMPYNSEANILLVTLLYLIKDQQTIFALFEASASTSTQLICEDRFLLLAKEAFVNTRSYKVLISSLMNFKPLFVFSICQLNRLLRLFISSSTRLITWAAKDRSNKASS